MVSKKSKKKQKKSKKKSKNPWMIWLRGNSQLSKMARNKVHREWLKKNSGVDKNNKKKQQFVVERMAYFYNTFLKKGNVAGLKKVLGGFDTEEHLPPDNEMSVSNVDNEMPVSNVDNEMPSFNEKDKEENVNKQLFGNGRYFFENDKICFEE